VIFRARANHHSSPAARRAAAKATASEPMAIAGDDAAARFAARDEIAAFARQEALT
jgi:hypothetical protein